MSVNHGSALWEQPIMRAARLVLEEHGVAVPPVMVNVGFRRASGSGFATTFYYFNPERDGISSQASNWAESEWHRSRLSNDPRRVEYIKQLIVWGRNWEAKYYSTASY